MSLRISQRHSMCVWRSPPSPACAPSPPLPALFYLSSTSPNISRLFRVCAVEKLPLPAPSCPPPSSLYFTKQTIGNACGTIAVLHAILNNRDRVPLLPDSFFARFLSATSALSPDERARYLESPPEDGPDLEGSHAAAAAEGDTPAADPETRTDLHFVALVRSAGRVWELDGRKSRPVDRGPSDAEEGFLGDVTKIVRETFLPNADSIEFNLIALAKAG